MAARPGAQPAGLVQFAEAADVSQRNRRKPLTPVRASTLESLTKNAYIKNPNENNPVRLFGGELSPLYELRKSDIGAASSDCFSVSFTDSIELLCFLSGSEK